GPAGATTALLLARAGASVLLVDRARFPRDKACSEYLSPATTEILERLGGGILDAVEGAAHAKLYGMKVVAPCGATMCGRFRGGPRPYSFALPRTTFDTILVAAAARGGAQEPGRRPGLPSRFFRRARAISRARGAVRPPATGSRRSGRRSVRAVVAHGRSARRRRRARG